MSKFCACKCILTDESKENLEIGKWQISETIFTFKLNWSLEIVSNLLQLQRQKYIVSYTSQIDGCIF